MIVRRAQSADTEAWLRMRRALWPEGSEAEFRQEIASLLQKENDVAFVAEDDGSVIGFIEVSLRNVAEGCSTSPVGYVEGWYVAPEVRRQGIGRTLFAAAEEWARSRGCSEMGSDTEIDNVVSRDAHAALGYTFVGANAHFAKRLSSRSDQRADV